MLKVVALFSLFSSLLCAQIVEVRTMAEVRTMVDPEALIVFDIDNTIMETAQTLGSDQWFYHRRQFYLSEGFHPQEALEMALAEWMAVQNLTPVQLVEEEVQGFIEELQREGVSVMGLTTRGLGLATRTLRQLHSLQVDLSPTAPLKEETLFKGDRAILYRQGILFTAGTHKGRAFLQLCEKIGGVPRKVVFINDKENHLAEVEESCEASQVEFLGLRYGFLDEKVALFSHELASVQWDHFGRLISDEHAQAVLFDLEGIGHAKDTGDEVGAVAAGDAEPDATDEV